MPPFKGLRKDRPDFGDHGHECPSVQCRRAWYHGESDVYPPHATPESTLIAHSCPDCGTEQFWKMPLDKVISVWERCHGALTEYLAKKGGK